MPTEKGFIRWLMKVLSKLTGKGYEKCPATESNTKAKVPKRSYRTPVAIAAMTSPGITFSDDSGGDAKEDRSPEASSEQGKEC